MQGNTESAHARRETFDRVVRHSLGAGVALMLASSVAAQHAAHEHGVAALRVALDGPTLLIEFDSPLDNLVGFEHAPTTDEQRFALASAERRLKDFEHLFSLPAAAGCVVAEVQLDSPYPQSENDHGHDHREHHDHGHQEHHDHDDHGHEDDGHEDHGHAHGDIYVVYQLECSTPSALTEIGVGLIDAFPRIHVIRAETATPRGQASVRLDRAGMTLPL